MTAFLLDIQNPGNAVHVLAKRGKKKGAEDWPRVPQGCPKSEWETMEQIRLANAEGRGQRGPEAPGPSPHARTPPSPRHTPSALSPLEPRTRRRRPPGSYPVRDALSVEEAAAATSPDKRVCSSGTAIRAEQRERRALRRKPRPARPGSRAGGGNPNAAHVRRT